MKTRLRRGLAMIALIAFVVTLLPPSAFAEAKTSLTRSQIDSRHAEPNSEAVAGIEIVPHKTENPKRRAIWDGSIATGFAGGSGSQGNPYLISDGSELAFLAQEVNGGNSYSGVYFKLTNDICLNDTSNWTSWGNGVPPQNEWIAIGRYNRAEDDYPIPFNGCFDGDGYAVRGVYINTVENYQGLFGYIDDESTIANLGVAESYICGYRGVGGVVGYNSNGDYDGGTVTNCYNMGIITGYSYVGGVVGNSGGDVTNCYNTGSVTSDGEYYVGGVVGGNGGYVTNCYNTGSVTGDNEVGGVVGGSQHTVTKCYNIGNVSGNEDVGGVVGYIADTNVAKCYNTGAVTGDERVGGIVGHISGADGCCGNVTNCYNIGRVTGGSVVGGVAGNSIGNVTNCYNTGSVNGSSYVGGVVGENENYGPGYIGTVTNCYYSVGCCTNGNSYGTALTSQQLLHSGNFVGFNFGSVWTMDGNPNYPYPELIGNEHGGISTGIPGDANGDGSITMADATLIARMALNLMGSVSSADFNGDGSISMADATLTARKALNLI